MGKFKIPTWLQNSSTASSTDPTENRKKQNRLSITNFSQLRPKSEVPKTTTKIGFSDDSAMSPSLPDAPSRMTLLAKIISEETEKIEAHLKSKGIPSPDLLSATTSDFPKLPDDVQESRQKIIYATRELSVLAHGPKESVRWAVWGFLDVLSLQVINHYDIAKHVPLDGQISLEELQSKTGLDYTNLARVLRHAMTSYIFHEPTPGFIVHTAASKALAEDKKLQDWIGFNAEDIFPSTANVLNALKAYPEATSLTQTGFNFAFNTVDKESMFATIGKEPQRARRFGGAMASLTGGEGYEVHHFVDNYDLSDVNERGGTFVDIGGSHGFVSVALAEKWKNIKFVVQDLPKTIESAPQPISQDADVAGRVDLQVHDFFAEQTVKDADVYFFRWIIHNYSTPYAIKILKNLVPSLKPGARIVINDHCLREPGTENPWDERVTRGMDMIMLTLLNAQERDEREFEALFKAADPGFLFKGSTRSDDCRMSVVEAIWNPTSTDNAQ